MAEIQTDAIQIIGRFAPHLTQFGKLGLINPSPFPTVLVAAWPMVTGTGYMESLKPICMTEP